MEVMKNIPPIANQIRTAAWHQIGSTMEIHYRDGLVTIERHLQRLADQGVITQEEARHHGLTQAPGMH